MHPAVGPAELPPCAGSLCYLPPLQETRVAPSPQNTPVNPSKFPLTIKPLPAFLRESSYTEIICSRDRLKTPGKCYSLVISGRGKSGKLLGMSGEV